MASVPSDDELRLLYLDWCSSQVARRFLELSLDEVWLRSQFAASLPQDSTSPPSPQEPRSVDRGTSIALERIPGYLDLVRKTALVLAREMNLPSFAEWKDDYLENPEAFRAEMLGS